MPMRATYEVVQAETRRGADSSKALQRR